MENITAALENIDLDTVIGALEKVYPYAEKAVNWVVSSDILSKVPEYVEKAVEIIGKVVEYVMGLVG